MTAAIVSAFVLILVLAVCLYVQRAQMVKLRSEIKTERDARWHATENDLRSGPRSRLAWLERADEKRKEQCTALYEAVSCLATRANVQLTRVSALKSRVVSATDGKDCKTDATTNWYPEELI